MGQEIYKADHVHGASGFQSSEEVKVDVLGHHLTGMAERYYVEQVEGWCKEKLTLEHAI